MVFFSEICLDIRCIILYDLTSSVYLLLLQCSAENRIVYIGHNIKRSMQLLCRIPNVIISGLLFDLLFAAVSLLSEKKSLKQIFFYFMS